MYMCTFQSLKSVDDGIARCDGHNVLVDTVCGISLHLHITYIPPPLRKYKKYSCALPTINILKDIWCGLILKDPQNLEVTQNFCQLKLLLKTYGACTMCFKKLAPTPAPSNNFIFHY